MYGANQLALVVALVFCNVCASGASDSGSADSSCSSLRYNLHQVLREEASEQQDAQHMERHMERVSKIREHLNLKGDTDGHSEVSALQRILSPMGPASISKHEALLRRVAYLEKENADYKAKADGAMAIGESDEPSKFVDGEQKAFLHGYNLGNLGRQETAARISPQNCTGAEEAQLRIQDLRAEVASCKTKVENTTTDDETALAASSEGKVARDEDGFSSSNDFPNSPNQERRCDIKSRTTLAHIYNSKSCPEDNTKWQGGMTGRTQQLRDFWKSQKDEATGAVYSSLKPEQCAPLVCASSTCLKRNTTEFAQNVRTWVSPSNPEGNIPLFPLMPADTMCTKNCYDGEQVSVTQNWKAYTLSTSTTNRLMFVLFNWLVSKLSTIMHWACPCNKPGDEAFLDQMNSPTMRCKELFAPEHCKKLRSQGHLDNRGHFKDGTTMSPFPTNAFRCRGTKKEPNHQYQMWRRGGFKIHMPAKGWVQREEARGSSLPKRLLRYLKSRMSNGYVRKGNLCDTPPDYASNHDTGSHIVITRHEKLLPLLEKTGAWPNPCGRNSARAEEQGKRRGHRARRHKMSRRLGDSASTKAGFGFVKKGFQQVARKVTRGVKHVAGKIKSRATSFIKAKIATIVTKKMKQKFPTLVRNYCGKTFDLHMDEIVQILSEAVSALGKGKKIEGILKAKKAVATAAVPMLLCLVPEILRLGSKKNKILGKQIFNRQYIDVGYYGGVRVFELAHWLACYYTRHTDYPAVSQQAYDRSGCHKHHADYALHMNTLPVSAAAALLGGFLRRLPSSYMSNSDTSLCKIFDKAIPNSPRAEQGAKVRFRYRASKHDGTPTSESSWDWMMKYMRGGSLFRYGMDYKGLHKLEERFTHIKGPDWNDVGDGTSTFVVYMPNVEASLFDIYHAVYRTDVNILAPNSIWRDTEQHFGLDPQQTACLFTTKIDVAICNTCCCRRGLGSATVTSEMPGIFYRGKPGLEKAVAKEEAFVHGLKSRLEAGGVHVNARTLRYEHFPVWPEPKNFSGTTNNLGQTSAEFHASLVEPHPGHQCGSMFGMLDSMSRLFGSMVRAIVFKTYLQSPGNVLLGGSMCVI